MKLEHQKRFAQIVASAAETERSKDRPIQLEAQWKQRIKKLKENEDYASEVSSTFHFAFNYKSINRSIVNCWH